MLTIEKKPGALLRPVLFCVEVSGQLKLLSHGLQTGFD
jgi:hypothetical protein